MISLNTIKHVDRYVSGCSLRRIRLKKSLSFRTLHDAHFNPNLGRYKVSALQPGLIVIKNGLSPQEQIKLTKIALEKGMDPNKGFWKIDEQGQKVLNQAPRAPHRGRLFDALNNFPKIISELCQENLNRAIQMDKTIQPIELTHLILLYYKTRALVKDGFINWHQDKDPNDGDLTYPVVSFTIGDSCDFLVCNEKPKINSQYSFSNPQNLAHRILFESGDVLIFGGSSRLIHHSIYTLHPGTAPPYLPLQDVRLNFTCRYAPKIQGEEEKFSSKNFTSVYHQAVSKEV